MAGWLMTLFKALASRRVAAAVPFFEKAQNEERTNDRSSGGGATEPFPGSERGSFLPAHSR